MRSSAVLFLFAALLAAYLTFAPRTALAASHPTASIWRIFADPDVRVSYDGDLSHMEGPIAASSTDPNVLVACSQVLDPGRWTMDQTMFAYYSHDAGAQWRETPLLPASANCGWDNAVVAGPGGVIYFVTHDFATDRLTVYATKDGGQTWTSGVVKDQGWDREFAAVDNTTGPYSGRLYIAGEHAGAVYMVSSPDDGKTFTAPVCAYHPPAGWQAGCSPSPIVLGDGALVVPVMPYPLMTGWRAFHLQNNGVVVSTDGGKTFSAFRSVGGTMNRGRMATVYSQTTKGDLLMAGAFLAAFAAAPRTGVFPDRLYGAWQSLDSLDRLVLYLSYSDDHGATWSKPRAVDAGMPAVSGGRIRQSFPMLAVNKEGTVGLAWFDGRDAHGGQGGYDIYYTASVDGGRSFLPSVRISSATSYPGQGASALPGPWQDLGQFPAAARKPLGLPAVGRIHSFTSAYDMRMLGGDYATMAADAAGRFHPLWYDARNGSFQLYTCSIRVLPKSQMALLSADPPRAAGALAQDKNVQVLYGEPRWDPKTKDMTVLVRLENTSNGIFSAPLNVKVQAIADPLVSRALGPSVPNPFPSTPIFNPKRRAYGPSADFTYPISRNHPLFPDSVSAGVPWRLHISRPELARFTLTIQVTGPNPTPLPH